MCCSCGCYALQEPWPSLHKLSLIVVVGHSRQGISDLSDLWVGVDHVRRHHFSIYKVPAVHDQPDVLAEPHEAVSIRSVSCCRYGSLAASSHRRKPRI